MAEQISKLAPLAIRSCIKAVNKGLEMDLKKGLELEIELFSQIFATEDMKEGTSAFLEKRKAVFRGK
jgi:enoyl-CoA hydratase